MKTQLLQRIAIALGLVIAIGQAPESSGGDPSENRWNQFKPPSKPIPSSRQPRATAASASTPAHSVAMQAAVETLPPPRSESVLPQIAAPDPIVDPAPQPAVEPYPFQTTFPPGQLSPLTVPGAPRIPQAEDCECGSCQSAGCGVGGLGGVGGGLYAQPISPWYGGVSSTFWSVADSDDRSMVAYDNLLTVVRSSEIGSDSSSNNSGQSGVDVHAGRYLGCGCYGLDIGYLYWDPDPDSKSGFDRGSGLRFLSPALRDVSIDRGGGAITVFDDFDNNATEIRATRDIALQGIEINLYRFGLMGARRLGSTGPACQFGIQAVAGSGYYGGAIGPLARPGSSRLRVQTMHGFRWLQFKDELQVAGDVDGTPGLSGSDLFYDIQTENNLLGYQFGTRLSYCLGRRAMLNCSGKMGLYANDVTYRQRIGTDTTLAFATAQGPGAGDILTNDHETTLAGLGELDLGLGYRLSARWTARIGYRVMALSNVATSISQLDPDFTTAASSAIVNADGSLVVHGAYVGIDMNW
ncbi:BBP7 family outer membrane beta-barrel protein [Stieleria sp. TO1_6]|uniref:BBP7 family outer membrane beta-barrel protein n=1 Tax=Stieleria tagensis TaxID=2956795 RepID=UPI00209B1975|nr:BBP7 family outer membrane beta-barrel protein [Stieleria tagensis]MCO8125144.1 BBP7 family outer membrane beta-barrel protein [Stieleria tagensis]